MYPLLGIDAVLRIAAAMALLFVVVPSLALRRPPTLDRLQWFWLCFAAGTVALTLVGQLLTLVNAYASVTLLLVCAAFIVIARGGWPFVHRAYRVVVVGTLNVLEGRVSLRRRVKRLARRLTRRTREAVTPRWAGWAAVIGAAATTRFYRPFATANLGFSDTYVHLYLVRLLEQGRQVDPAWGPYPRGMHFLLLAIHELTNVNEILLMNFFGPCVGVLMVIAVADSARRLGRSFTAGIVAGLLFATLVGGASQYFLLGGSFAVDSTAEARRLDAQSYGELTTNAGEFDIALTSFQRQSSTLPQELAIVFLFPGAVFLLDALRRRPGLSPAHMWGYLACTAAIACTHPGVLVPYVVLSGLAVVAARASLAQIGRVMGLGAIGVAVGSTWMLAFIAYPYTGGAQTRVGGTSMYYFPLLRHFDADLAKIVTWVSLTPALIICIVIVVAILLARRERNATFGALALVAFFLMHVASRWRLPEIVEIRRNAEWFAIAICIAAGIAIASLPRRALVPVAVALAVVWTLRVPNLAAAPIRDRILNYSGYGATAYAVLDIERRFEPFTWTLVTYGQEFPMVLGRGFHLAAPEFLDRYDPAEAPLRIPTKYVFIAVEKNPHPFQIDTWKTRFSRTNIESRLQTWCFLYGMSHRDLRVYLDDANVRVYEIRRSDAITRQIANEARR